MIEEVGAMVQFLPPYSPDLNPIEEAFSKVKSTIKSYERTVDTSDTETITLTAISESDCQKLYVIIITASYAQLSNYISYNIANLYN